MEALRAQYTEETDLAKTERQEKLVIERELCKLKEDFAFVVQQLREDGVDNEKVRLS